MLSKDQRQRFDHSYLLGVLRYRKVTIASFASEMNMSKTAMDKKLNGDTPWKDHEINHACSFLGLSSATEVVKSFFTPASLQTQTTTD